VCLTDGPVATTTLRVTSRTMIVAADRERTPRTIAAGRTVVVNRTRDGWTVDGRTIRSPALEFEPDSSPGVWFNDHLYRGRLRITPVGQRSFHVINVAPLEHYLTGVIDGEVPSHFPAEARKAQAIAARTFAVMQRRLADPADDFDLRSSAERSQSYLGCQYRDSRGRLLTGESDAARAAVRDTLGLVCTWRGEVFRTYYSACCGGRTTRGSLFFPDAANLPSVACDACGHCPRAHWTARLTAEELADAVQVASHGQAPPSFVPVDATVEGSTNRDAMPRIRVTSAKNQTMTASTGAFRTAVGGGKLLSSWFTIRRESGDFLVEGCGHGHGVGLCQWGAAGLAQDGADFRTILARYYPGSEIQPISSLPRGPQDRP
jgi:stage II sporulation protein D